MIVIINGTPGSGKSKTAEYLFKATPDSAWVDGDWLLATNPHGHMEQRLLRYKNISSLVKNFHDSGFTTIFISFVYVSTSNLEEQIDLLKNIDSVKIIALVPNEETLRKRHSGDSYKREGIESSIEINNKISLLPNIEIIDNSKFTIDEVGNKIIDMLSLK